MKTCNVCGGIVGSDSAKLMCICFWNRGPRLTRVVYRGEPCKICEGDGSLWFGGARHRCLECFGDGIVRPRLRLVRYWGEPFRDLGGPCESCDGEGMCTALVYDPPEGEREYERVECWKCNEKGYHLPRARLPRRVRFNGGAK